MTKFNFLISENMKFSEGKHQNNNKIYKIFMGGLTRETKECDILNYFNKYSDTLKVEIVYNKKNKLSRNFGFLFVKNKSEMLNILNHKYHIINNKIIECKKADYNNICNKAINENFANFNDKINDFNAFSFNNNYEYDKYFYYSNKIFLGGLGKKLEENDILNYFVKFGSIEGCKIVKKNGVSRGFGFVTFKSEESIDKIKLFLENNKKLVINNTVIDCRIAQPDINYIKNLNKKINNEMPDNFYYYQYNKSINTNKLDNYINNSSSTNYNSNNNTYNNCTSSYNKDKSLITDSNNIFNEKLLFMKYSNKDNNLSYNNISNQDTDDFSFNEKCESINLLESNTLNSYNTNYNSFYNDNNSLIYDLKKDKVFDVANSIICDLNLSKLDISDDSLDLNINLF